MDTPPISVERIFEAHLTPDIYGFRVVSEDQKLQVMASGGGAIATVRLIWEDAEALARAILGPDLPADEWAEVAREIRQRQAHADLVDAHRAVAS